MFSTILGVLLMIYVKNMTINTWFMIDILDIKFWKTEIREKYNKTTRPLDVYAAQVLHEHILRKLEFPDTLLAILDMLYNGK